MADSSDPIFTRAAAAHAAGDFETALQGYVAVLSADAKRLDALDGLTRILETVRTKQFHPGIATLLERSLGTPGARRDGLMRSAEAQLALKYRMADPSAVPSFDILDAFARDGLMLAALHLGVIGDPVVEAFLCRARRALCAPDAKPKLLALAIAFAQQAVNNDYVWPITAEDEAALTFVASDEFGVARRAMFAPLDPAAASFPTLGAYAAERAKYEAAQHSAEQRIASLYPLTPDAFALATARDGHRPAPRWQELRLPGRTDIRAGLGAQYAWAGPFPDFAPPLLALVPSAGTCHLALSMAVNYENVQVEAVDLSRRALAFGLAQAESIGVPNIHFSQADLLDLPKTGAGWGHAEALDVLGIAADPRASLAALVDVLAPGSFLRLGAPGKSGGALLGKARAAWRAAGAPTDLAGLRRWRAELLAGKFGSELQRDLPHWHGFHSAAALAAFCLQPHDTRFDIAGLRALFDGLPVKFLGFEFDAGTLQSYRKRFPAEPTCADLANWQKLEAAQAEPFGFYRFWLLRI
ncbi:MAG: class I SAM-dependent methyltransferase [Telmatospirillum sp.]|nr:class I SAM-dependent methyltransferase [Telmatospirillum sp.]